ncbi:M13 family metallopeptidase [Sphingosinicella sp. BN140058]|uniref:M13 family metallopeptidase n=1 Tax=Sphingosinicella sp. BN140058 TaxID=1892855 RepID=UPI0010114ABB|nr:M13-type metalloendopeptidase [Sphingosinicella sp. BN140058]QAY78838.1 M13 family peptidase [Sphingosinicella sp. BN140058]
MIKHMMLSGAALFALAGAAVPAAAQQAAAARGAPELGAWGFDLTGMDKSVNPGDSFYDYANGNWNRTTEIPADRSSWGGFGVLRDLSDQRTRDIVEAAAKTNAPAGSVQRKVGDLYASFMDEAAIEKAGLTPLKPFFAKIDAIATPSDLARAFGEANRMGISTPFSAGVEQDLKDNSQYGVYLGQGGLGLPDRDYYLDDTNPKFVETRAKYQTHVATMFRLAGIPDGEGKAKRIYDLEKKIAQTHWTRAESRQIDKLYNPVPTNGLGERMPGFDWAAYLKAASLDRLPQVIATQPSALTGEAKLVASEPLQTWKDYLTFRTLSAAAGMLPKAISDENFAFYGTTLSGTPKQKDRWKRGADVVNGAMGEAVGELYVAKYFTPAAKAKADELVRNLIRAMDARLEKLEWMAPETRAKARAKLAAFTPKIGYPDKWRDYSALVVKPGDPVGNSLRATEFEYLRQLGKIGKPVDRSEWGMTPQTVNAYANPLLNEIVFPAAILQPPFFDPNADDAVNYGGIGAVIGHEITHHFDDQGSKFDAKGNLAEWWAPTDVERFKAMTAKVVQQYGEYEPLPGSKVNGELTLGENMADLAGLNIAYDAYRLSLNGKEAPVIDGYTGDQRFFLGFGQVWRNKYRDPLLLNLLTTDPHSPGHVRPNVVRNFDPWYKAFKVQGGKLYLKPEDRIRIW